MALNASKIPGKKFDRPEPLEAGTYPVRVVQIISLGLQEQRPFKGEPKDPGYEVMVTYECLDEFLKDKETGEELVDKPRWLSETFVLHPLDSDLAKSTKRYAALDPEFNHKGDWSKLAGTPAMMTVVLNQGKGKNADRVYENVASLSTMRAKEASKAPELVNPPKVFDLDDPDLEIYLSLPQWIQDKMKDALDFENSTLENVLREHQESPKGVDTSKESKAPKEAAEEASEDSSEGDEDW